MIYVIGDIILDDYKFFSSSKHTPEADVPILKLCKRKFLLGGAANVALNIKKLGSDVNLIGTESSDSKFKRITSLLNKYQLNNTLYPSDNSLTVKVRVNINGEYAYREDYDPIVRSSINAKDVSGIIQRTASYLVISDYNKKSFYNYKGLIEEIPLLTIVDPKGPLSQYDGAFIIKPNLKEFSEWLGVENLTIENILNNSYIHSTTFKLLKETNNVIVTVGDNGAILLRRSYDARLFPNKTKIIAKDVTGAGDSFLAGLVAHLDSGNSMYKSIEFANRVASISVTKPGTSYVNYYEI